eukprot:902807-Rhodomonas_salina.2
MIELFEGLNLNMGLRAPKEQKKDSSSAISPVSARSCRPRREYRHHRHHPGGRGLDIVTEGMQYKKLMQSKGFTCEHTRQIVRIRQK